MTSRNQAQGHTLIVVTHDIHVGEIADRLITLEHGRVAHSRSNGHRPVSATALLLESAQSLLGDQG